MDDNNLEEQGGAVFEKKVWQKPDLVVIEETTATNSSKPNRVPFESSPGWGIS